MTYLGCFPKSKMGTKQLRNYPIWTILIPRKALVEPDRIFQVPASERLIILIFLGKYWSKVVHFRGMSPSLLSPLGGVYGISPSAPPVASAEAPAAGALPPRVVPRVSLPRVYAAALAATGPRRSSNRPLQLMKKPMRLMKGPNRLKRTKLTSSKKGDPSDI